MSIFKKIGKGLKNASIGALMGPVVGAANVVSGGKITNKLGGVLFGKDGKPLDNTLAGNAGYQGLNSDAAAQNDPALQAAMDQAAQSGDLSSVLATGAGARGASVDPRLGSVLAAKQVQDNPLSAGYFGKGGMSDRMLDEEKDLSSRGYSMQPEDNEAYGQASDEIARLGGQEEASLSRALADRGLAAGPNGAAAVGFSGLQGNKFERLAGAQRKIAGDRMKSNQERLTAVRNQSMQMGKQGQDALNDQYTRNLQGIQDRRKGFESAEAAGVDMQNQNNQSQMFKEKTKKPGAAGEIMAAGGAALGGMLGGPQGAQLGGSLGGALGKGFQR